MMEMKKKTERERGEKASGRVFVRLHPNKAFRHYHCHSRNGEINRHRRHCRSYFDNDAESIEKGRQIKKLTTLA